MEANRQSPPRPAVDEVFLDKVQQALEAALRSTAGVESLLDAASTDQVGIQLCGDQTSMEGTTAQQRMKEEAARLEADLVRQQAELREWLEHFTELQRRMQTLLQAPLDRNAA
jgi:hypothetical protein